MAVAAASLQHQDVLNLDIQVVYRATVISVMVVYVTCKQVAGTSTSAAGVRVQALLTAHGVDSALRLGGHTDVGTCPISQCDSYPKMTNDSKDREVLVPNVNAVSGLEGRLHVQLHIAQGCVDTSD